MERQQEVVCTVSNGDIFNDLDGPLTRFFMVTEFLKSNISKRKKLLQCKRENSGNYGFIVSLVVINFHPLSRVNVSITLQPQSGCLQFHETTSRDRVSHRFSQKQTRPNFLPCKKYKIFTHMKYTIKEIIDASTATHVLSFSFYHYVTAEVFPSSSVQFQGHLQFSNNFLWKQDNSIIIFLALLIARDGQINRNVRERTCSFQGCPTISSLANSSLFLRFPNFEKKLVGMGIYHFLPNPVPCHLTFIFTVKR